MTKRRKDENTKGVRRAFLLVMLMALAAQMLWAWPWSRDMVIQPIVRPLLLMFRPAPGAVAVGSEAPMMPEAVERAAKNPFAATPENIQAGKKYYATFCYPCHGAGGHGDGSVAGGALQPTDLTNPLVQKRSDVYIYGVIRNGVRSMPQYHESLSPKERWQVVLFVRTLAKSRE